MNTREFLEALWPPQGIYCLATRWVPPGATEPTYRHRTADSIDGALAIYRKNREVTDVFFCVHTLKEHQVWNATKHNYKTNGPGAYEKRTQANMLEARCLFLDLDVGETTKVKKYATRDEALSELDRFIFVTGLPWPMTVSSGSGIHCYWRMPDSIPSLDWRKLAQRFHHIVRREGLLADPARTTDQSSVLRVLHSYNFKPKLGTRQEVVLFNAGEETPNADLIAKIDELVGNDTIEDRTPRPSQQSGNPAHAIMGSQGGIEFQAEPVTITELIETCEHVADFAAVAGAVDEPVWYNMLGVIQYVEDGEQWCQELSKGDPRYSYDATLAKLVQYNSSAKGPPLCATLDAKCGGDACARCPVKGVATNPLSIIRKRKQFQPKPDPQIALAAQQASPPPAPGVSTPLLPLIQPPKPFERVKAGISMTILKDGKPSDEVILLPYDLFPLEIVEATTIESGHSVWVVELPLEGQRLFKITTAHLTDDKSLHLRLLDSGIYPSNSHVPGVRNFMSAYLRELRKHEQAHKQYDHLGWTKDRTEFVLPETVYNIDGTSRPTRLSPICADVKRKVAKKGSLQKEVELLDFYNQPGYEANQFMILAGLASPLMAFTGLHGAIVNATGEPGASKSYTLSTAVSHWGNPVTYPLSGTPNANTRNSENTLLVSLANLPFGVDEATLMSPDELRERCLSISQKDPERGRLRPDITARPSRSEDKALLALFTSNRSIYSAVGTDNAAGTATSMRVFEMKFPPADRNKKVEADAFMRELSENYGHIGETFIAHVIQHRDAYAKLVHETVARVDAVFKIESSERYHSAIIAVVRVAWIIGRHLGLIPYEWKPINAWLVNEQIPAIRGTIAEEVKTIDPTSLLTNYIAHIAGNTVVISNAPGARHSVVIQKPTGEWKAHFAMEARELWVRKDGFRRWLQTIAKQDPLAIFRDLMKLGVISGDVKRTLGLGMEEATTRSVCFIVDLTKSDIAEIANLPTTPAGNVVAFTPNIGGKKKGEP